MPRENLARKIEQPTPSPETPETGADLKAREALTAAKAEKSPQEILAKLKATEIRAQKRKEERDLRSVAEIVDIFDVCESLNPNFSPDFLSSAAKEVARAEKTQKEGSREQTVKKAESKYNLPQGLLEKYIALTEKIGTGSIMTLFKKFETNLEKVKKEGKTDSTLEAAAEKVAKWSQLEKWGGRTPSQEKMDTTAKANQELINSVLNGKLTPDAVLDLTTKEKKMLLNYASELAAQPGLAGADFYQKLDKLGITPKTARVSEIQARFRERAAASEAESAGRGITSGGAVTETRSALINPLEKPKAMVTTAPVEAEKPAKQEGALRNFWRRLTGKYELPEDRLRAEAEQKQKDYYAPLLKQLEKTGRNLFETSNLVNLTSNEYTLATDILNGKKRELSEEDKEVFKEARRKVMTGAEEAPNEKSLEILADLYEEMARQTKE